MSEKNEPQEMLEVRIQVQVLKLYRSHGDHYNHSGESLSISQTYTLRTADFMELASILGQFNTLAEKIKQERGIPR